MDKYDRAIELLNEFDDNDFSRMVEKAWGLSGNEDVKDMECLFQYCGNGSRVGCLTIIRSKNDRIVEDRPDLTEQIRNDERLPKMCSNITRESLYAFAEWQRILDKELGRE